MTLQLIDRHGRASDERTEGRQSPRRPLGLTSTIRTSTDRNLADFSGAPVTPIVVVHGKGVTVEGWFQKPTIDGVRFCSGARLRKVLLDRKAVLDTAEVDRIAGLLRR